MSVAATLVARALLLLLLHLLYKPLWICCLGIISILVIDFFSKGGFFFCPVEVSFVWRCV